MKLTCIIIDDEPLAVELMESYVLKTPYLELAGSYGSGTAAYAALREHPVDLLFCDIQMPGLNGMELSRMLPENTRVIFTTAFSQYAIEGFRVQAVDYLLKPISYNDFLDAANKVRRLKVPSQPAPQHRTAGRQRLSDPAPEPEQRGSRPPHKEADKGVHRSPPKVRHGGSDRPEGPATTFGRVSS